MLSITVWILCTYCVLSNAYSYSHQQNSRFSFGLPAQGYVQQSAGYLPRLNSPPPQIRYSQQAAAARDPQGYTYSRPQVGFGLQSQFPGTQGYSLNVPSSPHSHGLSDFNRGQESADQQRHHSKEINYHSHHQQSYGGQQRNSVHDERRVTSQRHNAPYPSHSNVLGRHYSLANYGQKISPLNGVQHYHSNAINQESWKPSLESEEIQSSNEERGLHLATGGYGPDALTHHTSANTFGSHASKRTITGLQAASGGYGPDAINLSVEDEVNMIEIQL